GRVGAAAPDPGRLPGPACAPTAGGAGPALLLRPVGRGDGPGPGHHSRNREEPVSARSRGAARARNGIADFRGVTVTYRAVFEGTILDEPPSRIDVDRAIASIRRRQRRRRLAGACATAAVVVIGV